MHNAVNLSQSSTAQADFDATFEIDVCACARFIAQRGSYPSPDSVDPSEQALGRWLEHVRQIHKLLPPRQLAVLERVVPGWRTGVESVASRPATLFESRVAAYARYVAQNRREPSALSLDASERELGWWIGEVRRDGDLTSDMLDLLDRVVPAWRAPVRKETAFEVKLREYAMFVTANWRRPNPGSSDPLERRLHRWITSLGRRADHLPRKKVLLLNDVLGVWKQAPSRPGA